MRTVTVTGTGTSTVAPDSAVLRLAAVTRGAGVAEAYDALTRDADRLVAVAAEHTERRRIASTGVSVWPFHDHEGRRQGYEARHGFAVGCADLAEAGVLLAHVAREVGDALVVDSVGLEVTEDHGAASSAREAAFHDASERAAALARMSGARLGEVQSVVEGGADGPPGSPKLAMMREASGGLEPGETTVTATVTVVWELV